MVLRRSKFPKTSLSVGLAPLRRKLETTVGLMEGAWKKTETQTRSFPEVE